MEPISYFVGMGNGILVYVYFMLYKRDFSFDDWRSRLEKYFKRKGKNVGPYTLSSLRCRQFISTEQVKDVPLHSLTFISISAVFVPEITGSDSK
jgi:hypothetical protein